LAARRFIRHYKNGVSGASVVCLMGTFPSILQKSEV
jgi:hypothetical protein